MQAITTKFIGPTDTKGQRIKVTAGEGRSMTIPWPDALNVADAHRFAAMTLIRRLGWDDRTWVQGYLPTGVGYTFVVVLDHTTLDFTNTKEN